MLKWNLPSPLALGQVRPFLEGGAAFRTSQDDLAVLSSQFGMTAGVGAAIRFGKLRVAPSIRYTRWHKETYFPPYPTKDDQVEFLTSVAWGDIVRTGTCGRAPAEARGPRGIIL